MHRIISKLRNLYRFYTMSNIEYARYLGVKVGKECRIYTKDFGSEPWLIEIGNKVTVTNGVRFINHDGSTWLIEDHKGRRQLFRRIHIGNRVFIGMNSILLPGVKIGDNVIIAAGSVVSKSIPSNSVVGGNPAKFIISFDEYREKALKNYISNEDMNFNLSYRSMVENVIDESFKQELKPNND